MKYQVSVILTDGSQFFLEKINITKKDVNESKKKYKIPDYYQNKAIFVAKLFNDYELKVILDFLLKNDYIKSYTVTKINPLILEDDVISFSKIARTSNQESKWETISLGQINHMFVMGYGLISKNFELRKIERDYQGCLILLELIDAEKSMENINRLKEYLINVKKVDNISEFANKILNSKTFDIQNYAEELRKIVFSNSSKQTQNNKYVNKIIKIPFDSWQD